MTYIRKERQAFPWSSQSLPSLPEHQIVILLPILRRQKGCQTKVLSQDVRSAVSFPQFSGSRCQELPGVARLSFHVTSPSTGQLSGKLQKSAQYPGAARKKRTFPTLKGEGDASKGRSNYRP